MTNRERKYYMGLLEQARTGDERACNELTAGLAKYFSYMIRGYSSVDPAYDRDDLMLQFQYGIWHAIEKVDERGDPLYHLAWRGRAAVCSLLTVIKQRRHGTKLYIEENGERSIGTLPEGWDPPDTRPEAEPEHELVEADIQRERRALLARVMEHPELSPRQRRVVEALGVVSVRGEHGANLRLAQALGVSAQAAGVLHKRVLSKLGQEQAPVAEWRCLACGRTFGSKGALTQHERGQSGHKPCAAVESG